MSEGRRGAGRMVYIVDDELLLAQIMEAILQKDGFRVRTFTDPQAAWDAFQSADQKPALLVTDYVMQPINGLELLERCRAADPQLRSVMVSGNCNCGIFDQASNRPNAFLEKPFLPRKLIETAHWVLDQPS